MVSRQSHALELSAIGIRGSIHEWRAPSASPAADLGLTAASRPGHREKIRGIVNRFVAAVALCLAAVAGPAAATTYYVAPAPAGNDSNDGINQPWRTIKKAADTVSPGDTVYIRGGTYIERLTFTRGGTPTSKVVIRGYPGETAVIDGNNTLPSDLEPGENWSWGALVSVRVSDIEFRDLTIRKSLGFGLYIGGQGYGVADVVVDNVKVNTTMQSGLMIDSADGVTITDCEVSDAGRTNASHNENSWPVALVAKKSSFTTVRGCNVHENHGENIGDLLSDNSTIEDNFSWDSFKVNIYLDNSRNTILRRNIVYNTDNTFFWRQGTQPSQGILVNSENYGAGSTISYNQLIVNNFVYNTGEAFGIWYDTNTPNASYRDSTIAYNTFVSTRTGASGNGYGVRITSIPASGNVFRNNIVSQAAGTIATGSTSGYVFSNNDWSSAVTGGFSGSNDVVAPPQLQLGTGQHPTSDWLKLAGTSPAIDKALVMSGVTTDFFGTARGSSPDIGAHEVTSGGGGGGSNLLGNPGFETTTNWTNFPFLGAQQDATAHSGSFGLKIRVDSGYTDVYQQVSVTPGATYLASVWAKTYSTDNASRGQMSLQFYQNGTPIGAATNVTDPNGNLTWAQLQTGSPITAPAGATHLRVTLRRATALAGNYFFDEAEIKSVNLLANPGFETSGGWTNFQTAGAIQEAPGHVGAFMLKIRVDSGYTDVYQQVGVTPGTAYQTSVWASTYSVDNASRAQMSLQWYQNGTPIGTATNVTDPNGNLTWVKLQAASPITAPAGATHLRMTLRRATALGGNYYFDEAEIK
jgi:hypothetical protein